MPPLPRSLLRPFEPIRTVVAVTHWPVQSQVRARRNALVANTELSRQRAQREEVERFLDGSVEPAVPRSRSGDARR